jgi:hypothetical protein
MHRATEMDITMIGLQNAGKTSLLRVLAVSFAHRFPNVSTIVQAADLLATDRAENSPWSMFIPCPVASSLLGGVRATPHPNKRVVESFG